MTDDIETKINRMRADLEAVAAKLTELEALAEQAGGNLSESFAARLDELRHDRSLLEEHLTALELDKAQAWQQANLGHDLGEVARNLVDRIGQLAGKFSSRDK